MSDIHSNVCSPICDLLVQYNVFASSTCLSRYVRLRVRGMRRANLSVQYILGHAVLNQRSQRGEGMLTIENPSSAGLKRMRRLFLPRTSRTMRKVGISCLVHNSFQLEDRLFIGEMFHHFTDALFGTGVFNSDGKRFLVREVLPR